MSLRDRDFSGVALQAANFVFRPALRQIDSSMNQTLRTLDGFSGSMVEFWLGTTSRFHGVGTTLHTRDDISSVARAVFPQSHFSAACYDIGLGRFDFGMSAFWITEERLLYTNFLPSLRSDYIYLYTRGDPKPASLWKTLERPFFPFSWSLWAGIAGVLVLMACFFVVVRVIESDNLSRPSATIIAQDLAVNVYSSFSKFVGGDGLHADSPGKKLVNLGLHFFILIAISACASLPISR